MARVLVVCTANVCRSPAAVELLALGADSTVSLVSAGLRAAPGQELCPVMSDWLTAGGVPYVASHLSQQVTTALVRPADLVLTMTRDHRAGVLKLLPSRQGSTFTLAQAARLGQWVLGAGIPPQGQAGSSARVLWMVEELDAARARAPMPQDPDVDDLEDPHEGTDHGPVLQRLRDSVDVLATLLRQ